MLQKTSSRRHSKASLANSLCFQISSGIRFAQKQTSQSTHSAAHTQSRVQNSALQGSGCFVDINCLLNKSSGGSVLLLESEIQSAAEALAQKMHAYINILHAYSVRMHAYIIN
jgi:hypothetical protein